MAKSEYLMLAHTFNPGKNNIGGWFLSEKLDGTRCFWDGGISRGVPAEQVPYANTYKDSRLVDEVIATGLWSRTGKVIHAPEWWLDNLPDITLDGELYGGIRGFQTLRKTIANFEPNDADWQGVGYRVFDSPSPEIVFRSRDIKIRNDYSFRVVNALPWAKERGVKGSSVSWGFETTLQWLSKKSALFPGGVISLVPQMRLAVKHLQAVEEMENYLNGYLEAGGEGVMLRRPESQWLPERSHNLLKYKPWDTADGVVTGYTFGEEGKTGQLLGLMGALIIDFNGKKLKLSGFTHQQRAFNNPDYTRLAVDFPGVVAPEYVTHPLYPRGTTIEFKYRELSDDGIPKEARFWRIRGEE
jgi:DNA ligase-1